MLGIFYPRSFARESSASEFPVKSNLSPISRFHLNFLMKFEERADVSSKCVTLCGKKTQKNEFSSFWSLFLLGISHPRPFMRESLAYESPVNSKLSPISRFPLKFSMSFEERANISLISTTLCGTKTQKN